MKIKNPLFLQILEATKNSKYHSIINGIRLGAEFLSSSQKIIQKSTKQKKKEAKKKVIHV